METIICKICKKEKKVNPYLKNKQIYCSAKCKGVDDSKRMIGNKNGFKKGEKPWNTGLSVRLSPKTEFKKGMVPWNKDKKGIHLNPKFEFKEGHIPENKVSVGTIKIRNDHTKNLRMFIKIEEPDKWMFYANYVWVKKWGENN